MPIYEYVCPQCGERFEKLIRSTSSQVEIRCPSCDAANVERKVSVFGLSGGTSGGLSFGGGCFFENGVGTTDGSGTLTLKTFTS